MKKLVSLFLAVTLILGMIPTFAFAEETGETHTHTFGEKMNKFYNVCTGGYETDYYFCSGCEKAYTDTDGTTEATWKAGEGHKLTDTMHFADWNKNNSGFVYDHYVCTTCGWGCFADGREHVLVDKGNEVGGENVSGRPDHPGEFPTPTTNHVPDLTNKHPADSNYAVEYYDCIRVNCPCKVDANGNLILPIGQTECVTHTPGTTVAVYAREADCVAGYSQNVYNCTACKEYCYADGSDAVESEASANPNHIADTQNPHNSNYTVCGGGYTETYYFCLACGTAVNADGDELTREGPANGTGHNFSNGITGYDSAKVNSCQGWYTEDCFECSVCENAFKAVEGEDGAKEPGEEYIEKIYPENLENAKHTAGTEVIREKREHDCVEGFPENVYSCVGCGNEVFQDGTLATWEAPNTNATHSPMLGDENKHSANYTECGGGYEEEWYECQYCRNATDADGNGVSYKEPTSNVHTPGSEEHPANYTDCGGGIREAHYGCSECEAPCDKDGNELYGEEGTALHTPGDEIHTGNYTECGGGYNDHYVCTVCHQDCNVDGTSAEWQDPADNAQHTWSDLKLAEDETVNSCQGWYEEDYFECTICKSAVKAVDGENGVKVPGDEYIEKRWPKDEDAKHTPGSKKYNANYTSCGGGFAVDYYECTECGAPCSENGVYVEQTEGMGKHTPGSEVIKANYTSCGGGINEDFHICTECDAPCDKDGNELSYEGGTAAHTLGSEKHPADYTECGGGMTEDYYICEVCGNHINENGEYANGEGPKEGAKHTPAGEVNKADYTECGGGFKEDYYYCKHCEQPTNANGESVEWFERDETVKHNAGTEEQEPNYAPCGGGYKDKFYICTECEQPCDKDGKDAIWSEPDPDATHNSIVKVPGQAPTKTEYGWKDHWVCEDCGTPFLDEKGEQVVENESDIIIPALGEDTTPSRPIVTPSTKPETKPEQKPAEEEKPAAKPEQKPADKPEEKPEETEKPSVVVDEEWLEEAKGEIKVTVETNHEEASAKVENSFDIINAVLTEEQKELVKNGAAVEIKISVNHAGDAVSEEDKKIAEKSLEEFAKEIPGLAIGKIVDISLSVKIGDGDWEKISEMNSEVDIVVDIPQGLLAENRDFFIIHVHNGAAKLLKDKDNNEATVTVGIDGFSAFAIAYSKTEETPVIGESTEIVTTPEAESCSLCGICPTFMNTCVFIWVFAALAGMIAIILAISLAKKKQA